MLSVLIPTYNYNTLPLVKELKQQLDLSNVIYEIIVQDDAGSFFSDENSSINNFENCHFKKNKENLGRSRNINLLVEQSKFDYILILDCDVFPKKKDFISKYLQEIHQDFDVIFGGISYDKNTKPENKSVLRWKYGIEREAISLKKRLQKPYRHLLTSNILMNKKRLRIPLFNSNITLYGYEDLELAIWLKKHNKIINHIENSVLHKNLETSEKFILKTQEALENLKQLEKKGILPKDSTTISSLHRKLFFLDPILPKISPFFLNKFKANLTSKNPNLFLFDLYKLLYFFKI